MDAWLGGDINDPMSGLQHDAMFGVENETWEDWLRWDPALEPASPEDGTMNSGSSKNDSPIQNAVLPVDRGMFGKNDETLAPPLIIGEEDTLDFAGGSIAQDANPFLFGDHMDPVPFDFGAGTALHPSVPKIQTDSASWTPAGGDATKNVALSAVSTAPSQGALYSAGAISTGSPNWHQSPSATSQGGASMSLNESTSASPAQEKLAPKKRGGRKRKAETQKEKEEKKSDDIDELGESPGEDGEPPVKKTSHNVIEKRYRNNLNDKIVELRNSVPSLRAKNGDGSEDLEGLTAAHKLNKATVMGKATEYIRHLEKRNKTMAEEMAALKARLVAVEAGQGTSPDSLGSFSNSPPSEGFRSRQPSSASQTFLHVPQDQSHYAQQYSQQQSPPNYNRPPNPPVDAQNQPQNGNGRRGGAMNKVMMGAMAGLMAMEGLSEQHDNTHQLFAVPTFFFKRGLDVSSPSSMGDAARRLTLPLLKLVLVFGTLLYLVAPILTFSTQRKQKIQSTVRLPAAPSLASPVSVRRKAWLTAVQTVYVPKHFLVEVVVVTAKMMMLSMRRLIGSEAYCSLVGTTKEAEAARIKAWDIAIDAQLAGGDAEVSYYRLLLTLMTSGTLPDSPIRLMQKAVHFRVFFWEMANAGYGNIIGFKQFTERVGEFYWESARKLQKDLLHAKAQGRPSEDDNVELLPDHLASLIEMPCEEVLVDEMIQRAWNLAWNKPSAHGTKPNAAKDGVVEDHAIRSPLDAVAAWHANIVLDDTLIDTLGAETNSWDAEYHVGTATSIAPPGSATQGRALAAKAVLSNMNRDANIVAALEALPAALPDTSTVNLVSHKPAAQDVCTALTLAKLGSLLTPSAPARARKRAHETLANLHLAPHSFTLLSAVATFRLLKIASNHRISGQAMYGLEELAASLRVWIGTSSGMRAGLEPEACGKVVDVCLRVARKVGGWEERDSGYGSAEHSPVRLKA